MTWATTKPGTEAGAIPAKVSVNARPIVTAGLAKLVLLVNQYAAPMYAPTAAGATADRPDRARAKISRTRPAVATTSPSHRCPADRSLPENSTAGRSNIRFARIDPAMAPRVWAAAYPPSWVPVRPVRVRRPRY